jgi:cystathionine beta-lyase/cystathionine gamma-synthase
VYVCACVCVCVCALVCTFDNANAVVVVTTYIYTGGHSDLIGGALIAKSASIGEKLRFLNNAVGYNPFHSITQRGNSITQHCGKLT